MKCPSCGHVWTPAKAASSGASDPLPDDATTAQRYAYWKKRAPADDLAFIAAKTRIPNAAAFAQTAQPTPANARRAFDLARVELTGVRVADEEAFWHGVRQSTKRAYVLEGVRRARIARRAYVPLTPTERVKWRQSCGSFPPPESHWNADERDRLAPWPSADLLP